METQEKTQKIRELKDSFRKMGSTLAGVIGHNKVVMTQGIAALGREKVHAIFQKVRAFDAFTEDNDPHGEHDFGRFELGDQAIIWKIDYYALDLQHGSEVPEDPQQTVRVLTIMRAEEY